ncbi:MAG: nucleoside kinase, partial [Lachnospiraceae bacterium]|nr:nucleoside kinase [Lachnospiraceae bacterium]
MPILKIQNRDLEYPAGTPFREISDSFQKDYPDDIILVRYQHNLCELFKKVEGDGELEFVTTAEKPGRSTYRRTVTFLMEAAAHRLYGGEEPSPDGGNADSQIRVIVQHSIGQGYYCEFRQGNTCLPADSSRILALKEKMKEMVARDLPVT